MRLLVAVSLVILVAGARAYHSECNERVYWEVEAEEGEDYTNEWVVEAHGGEHVAKRIARDYGLTFNGLAEPFEDHYIFTRDDQPKISNQCSNHLTRQLIGDKEVKWAEQQTLLNMELRALGNPEYNTYPYQPTDYEEPLAYYPERTVQPRPMYVGQPYPGAGQYEQPVFEQKDLDYAYQQQQQEMGDIQDSTKVSNTQLWADFDNTMGTRNRVGGARFGRTNSGWSNGYVTSSSDNGGRLGGGWLAGSGGLTRPAARPQGGSWSDDGTRYTFESSRPGYSYSYVESSSGMPGLGRPRPGFRPPTSSLIDESVLQALTNQLQGSLGVLNGGFPANGRPRPRPISPTVFYLPQYERPPPPAQPQYERPPPPAQPQYERPPPPAQPQYERPPPPAQPQYERPPPPAQPQYERPPFYVRPQRPPPSTGGQRPPPSEQPETTSFTDPNDLINFLLSNTGQQMTFSPSGGDSQGDLGNLGKFSTEPMDVNILDTHKGATPNIALLSTKTSAYKDQFTDPLWKKQWYCHDYRTVEGPVMDHNVVPVYKMSETGKGVKIAVVDDGCAIHPDLTPNMMRELNYDMNTRKPGASPQPGASHGTKCAGEIAMAANNGICGVGVAYDAKFAAVKKEGHGGMTMMFVEGSSLAYRPDLFDIYSNSWGPPDDGKHMLEIGHLNTMALKTGYFEGRGGKGAIYAFAGGNGRGDEQDNCAADAFVNSIYTLGIASASQRGKVVYYSERCTAIFATAYSGGNRGDEGVASVDLGGGCTTTFSGTSASVPIATGIIALVFGANKELTSRDIVHLTALSAEVAPLANNPDTWYRNGAGFWVSNDFGFGLLNALNMVKLAKNWNSIGERHACVVNVKLKSPQFLSVGTNVEVKFETTGCADNPRSHVVSLEEVLIKSVVEYPYRGGVSIYLTSPMGTKSNILETRPKDNEKQLDWEIKSFHNWGENPVGNWAIEVKANQLPGINAGNGYVFEFTAVLFGTAQKPWYHDNGLVPRKYSAFRLPNEKTSG